jgi:hypothetical protein
MYLLSISYLQIKRLKLVLLSSRLPGNLQRCRSLLLVHLSSRTNWSSAWQPTSSCVSIYYIRSTQIASSGWQQSHRMIHTSVISSRLAPQLVMSRNESKATLISAIGYTLLRMKTVVEKLLNCFLLLHLKYKNENENENGKVEHENEHKLTKYRDFRKRTNSIGFMSNTVDIRKPNTKYQYVVPSAWLSI